MMLDAHDSIIVNCRNQRTGQVRHKKVVHCLKVGKAQITRKFSSLYIGLKLKLADRCPKFGNCRSVGNSHFCIYIEWNESRSDLKRRETSHK